MAQKLVGIVDGVCEGKAFTEEMNFELTKSGAFKYGNGLMMIVNRPKWGTSEAVDVRYEKTTDLKILAEKWIKSFFGKNLKHYCLTTVSD